MPLKMPDRIAELERPRNRIDELDIPPELLRRQGPQVQVWDPSIWQRAKNYLFPAPPPGGFDRSDKPLRTIGKMGLTAGAEAVSGVALSLPDIAAQKLTGEPTLGGAVAKAVGLKRTPREESQGELLKRLGTLHTMGVGTGALVSKIPASVALKTILATGLTFGSAEAVDQAVQNITTDKPFEFEGIHFNAGVGTLFGAGAAGIQKFAHFVKGFRATRALAKSGAIPKTGGRFPGSRAEALQEIRAAQAKGTDSAEWKAVMDKYVRAAAGKGVSAKPPSQVRPDTYTRQTSNILKRTNEGIKTAHARGDTEAVGAIRAIEQMQLTNVEKQIDADNLRMITAISTGGDRIKTLKAAEAEKEVFTEEEKEWLEHFRTSSEIIQRAEKTPSRDMTPEEVKLFEEDFEAFSKSRGYTDADIQAFKDHIDLVTQGHAMGFTDNLLSSIERQVGQRLEAERATKELDLERQFRQPPVTPKAPELKAAWEIEPGKLPTLEQVEKARGAKGKDLTLPTVLRDPEARRMLALVKSTRKLSEADPTNTALKEKHERVREEYYAYLENIILPTHGLAEAKLSEPWKTYNPPWRIAKNQLPVLHTKAKAEEMAKAFQSQSPIYETRLMPERGMYRIEYRKKGKPGFVNVEAITKAHETFMKILEPSKAVERRLGKAAYAAVIRGIHNPDVAQIEFTEAELTGHDKTFGEMREWFSKFSDKDLRNLMASRGTPVGDKAQVIKNQALRDLPDELRGKRATNAIEQIANFNYRKLQSVVGEDINKVKDYFYGIYKEPDKVDSFVEHWKTTKRFTKEKKLPTVADAVAYGLELRHANPVDNLRAEYLGIARLEGMTWLKDELMRTGKGIFIDNLIDAPENLKGVVRDPVFSGMRLDPDLANLVNNLIAKNKITMQPQLNALRQANNFIRTVKFMGSAFHLLSVAKQSVADSGYLGFLKPTARRGFTRGFRASDPIFKTKAYKDYVAHGGGHRYSVESEAERGFARAIDGLNKNASKAIRVGALPVKVPAGFVKWMFQSYIPKVKYSKYLDVVSEQTKKLGRPLKAQEKIDVIKEQQNFYGMMNERLFGRSGTVTSALRFWFMSPGYAEGNYRTMLKAATQWGQRQEAEALKGLPGAKEAGFRASRSRSNIINSWILSGITAAVGTMILTGKPPKKPDTLDDLRDMWKIDTGQKDEKGRRIMIDMLTYDKDYFNVGMNVMRLRPEKALAESWRRIGGMKAPTAKIIADLALMAAGEAIYDWKGDRVLEITDPFLRKAMKLAVHEIKELEPISVSVFKNARKRDLDATTAAIGTIMGVRPTKTEKDKRDQQVTSRIYSLKGQQEELYLYLGRIKNPRDAIKRYNRTVQNVLDYKHVGPALKAQWAPKLLIDVDRLLQNKVYALTDRAATPAEVERTRKYLENFGISPTEADRLLSKFWARERKRTGIRSTDSIPVIGRNLKRQRLADRVK